MKVIIIGAVAAGSKAAAKLKRLKPNWQVIIYTADNHIAYSECGLPYYIAGAFNDIEKLIVRTPEDFEIQGIKVFIKHNVLKIYPDKKQILVKNLINNEQFIDNYDKLIIATGAKPNLPEIQNINLKNVFTLRTIEDGMAIKNIISPNKKAVILGGGYIGIELLEAFVKQGLCINLIQSTNFIMPSFDDDLAQIIQKCVLQKNSKQVKIINNQTIKALEGNETVKKVILSNNESIETDIVIISTGVKPNSKLAKDCGIELGKSGAIKVNPRMQTNLKDIYACGDCVEKYHLVAQASCWLPLGSTANKEGRCCAINISGEQDEFEGVLGSAVTKYFNFTMSMTGLTERQALKYGFEPISVIVKKNDKAGYMPNAENITIKLTADKYTQKILGAQGIGQGDVDKRINMLTSALLSKMTVQEFFNNDITYSPPFSTSIDPVLIAAQKLRNKLN